AAFGGGAREVGTDVRDGDGDFAVDGICVGDLPVVEGGVREQRVGIGSDVDGLAVRRPGSAGADDVAIAGGDGVVAHERNGLAGGIGDNDGAAIGRDGEHDAGNRL